MINKIKFLLYLKKNNIFISKKSHVSKTNILEGDNKVGSNSKLSNCYIGKYSYVGTKCDLKELKIGRYCSLGNRINTILGKHPLNFLSSHPLFSEKFTSELSKDNYKIIIKDDVWIGDDVKLLSGITINTGAIIGAGALVNKDVPAYAIVVGIPARIIKYRFSEEIIQSLLKSEWWSKDFKDLEKYKDFFSLPDKFLKNFK